MKRTTHTLSRLFAIGALAALGACGGGGGDSAAPGAPGSPAPAPAPVPTPAPPPPVRASFPGFDFALTTGAFWEYRWDYLSQSGDSSGTSTTRDAGRFWVVLGAPQSVAGVNMFAVQILGKSVHAEGGGFAPRWKYLALSGGKLLGSVDGTKVETIFDANTGRWPGGGFFFQIDPNKLTTAQQSTLSNPWLSTDAVRAGRSVDVTQCQNFPGLGTICGGDVSQTLREHDYYKGGIGPVGYYYKNSASFSGGGFLSFANWEHHLGKVSSSFENGTLPFVAESAAEHASPAAAQAVQRGNVVRADVYASDPGTKTTVTVNGSTVSVSIEDWYAITVAGPTQIKLTLSFESSTTADVDLYVMGPGPRGSQMLGQSVADNPATRQPSETLTISLPAAGTYHIGVDGFATPGGRVPYELVIE